MSKGYSFTAEDGRVYLVRCPRCNRENYAPSVATGQCAWCGHKEPASTAPVCSICRNRHGLEVIHECE
jgi:ribosomal protein L37E